MIRNLHVELGQGWPWWGVALVTLVVLGTMSLFYLRAARRVSRGYVAVLILLRLLAMIAILLCLFRPVIRFERGRMKRRAVAVLVDASQSMSVHDFAGQESRFERARSALMKKGGAADGLESHFDVHWFAFGQTARPLASRRALRDVAPDGQATDLAASMRTALGQVGGELGGVVLLTDGVNTTTSSPAEEIPRLGVPVYAVGVGSVLGKTGEYRDIALTRVSAKRDVAVRTTLPIRVFVESRGFPDRVVPVVLRENGVELAREELVLDDDPGPQIVTLKYTPQRKGDFELTVEVPPDAAERVTENNVSVFPVWVGDPRIGVLYVEGVPRSEYRDLRRTLEGDPQIEVISLLRTGPNLFLQQGNVTGIELDGFPNTYEGLRPFRVLILGSIESEAFSNDQLEFMRRFVYEGGGLMMLGGERSFGPGGYAGTPLAEVLPVVIGGLNDGQEREPFPFTLTPVGRAHPIFAGIADFFTGGSGSLPELTGCVRVLRAKPAAEVLAINPRRRNEHGPLVALASGPYGAGRVLAATVDSTYLWYAPMRGLGRDSPYVRYWGQAVRWLAGIEETRREVGARVSAYADRRFYEPGDIPRLSVRVTDEEGQVTDRAQVTAELLRDGQPLGMTTQLSPIAARRGDYMAELGALEPGDYEVVVRATLAGQPLGEGRVKFRVGEPTREFERLDLNEPLLKRLAADTGGRYLPLLSLSKLPMILRARQEQEVRPVVIFLWNTWLLFLAFVLMATAEWILRRRRLLS